MIRIRRDKAILTVILLGAVMTILTSALTTMSYRKMQADACVHSGVLNTTSAVRRLNYSLSFGKPINKFYGLKELIEGINALSYDINGVEITDDEGVRIESTGDMSREVRQSTPDEEYVIQNDGIYAFVDFDAGKIILNLDKASVDASTGEYIRYILRVDSYVMLGIVIMILLSVAFAAKDGISVKRMRITSILILVLSQFALGGLAMMKVDSSFYGSLDRISVMTAHSVENDINEVIAKGIGYDELTGMDEYLRDLSEDIPELDDIKLAAAGTEDADNLSSHLLEITGTEEGSVRLDCYYSTDLIKRKRINNFIDVLILILITVFISTEAVSFLTKHMELKDSRSEDTLYIPGFRLFIFAEGIAFALDSGFFSVFSARMFEAMKLPDSMSFLSGMPNTMYSVAVMIGLFGCSSLVDRYGMKKTLTAGISFGIIGYLLCAFAPNLPTLIGARFVFGFCDGIIINAVRLYAAAQEDKEMHNKLLVEYMSAINLGVCCGVVIGGLIADAASYNVVFITGAFIGLSCLFLIYFAGFPEEKKKQKTSFAIALKELRFPQVRIFMLFAVVPLYMASLFVEYTFPLFGDEINFSHSMVSGLLMINFMIIAYLTDPISDWVIKRFRTRQAMLMYMILQTVSIGLFVITSSIWAAILAIIFTSLWDCFGMVVIDSALDHVEGTVTEHSTMLQMVFGKLAMVIGPVAITSRLTLGAAKATGVIVITLLVGIVVYGSSIFYFRRKYDRKA